MNIYVQYKKTGFCFSDKETKESIDKRIEAHKKELLRQTKDKRVKGGFSFNVSSAQVWKDYEAEKKRLAEEAKAEA